MEDKKSKHLKKKPKKIRRRLGLKMVAGILFLGVFILAICTLMETPMYNITFIAQYEGDMVSFLHSVANFAGKENLSALAKAVMADNADLEQITQSEQYQRIDDFLKSFLRSPNPGRKADGMYTDCQILIYDHIPDEKKQSLDWRENATVLFDVCTDSEKCQSAGEQAQSPQDEETETEFSLTDTYNLSFGDDELGTPYYHAYWDYSLWTGEGKLNDRVLWFYDLEENGLCLAFIAHNSLIMHGDVIDIQLAFALLCGVVIIIVLIIALLVNRKTIIRPILQIAREAERFGRNSTQVSEKLEEIRTGDEIQLLSQNLLQLEKDIIRYVDDITRATAEKERIGAELDLATSIQADMLPHIFSFPYRDDFDLHASMTPAKEVGGDFYDFFLVGQDHLAMVMADVSGKGVPAALFMVIAKTLIKTRTQMGGTPAEILRDVNEALCEGNEAGMFVTVWMAVIDLTTGKGLAANAGHEHPALRRGDHGVFELIKYRHSMAIATMEGICFREHEFEMHPGDCLFVYTDGVPEATNALSELFGTDRMLEALNSNPNASPKELLQTVKIYIDGFVGSAEQFDDITMLCMRYSGEKQKTLDC